MRLKQKFLGNLFFPLSKKTKPHLKETFLTFTLFFFHPFLMFEKYAQCLEAHTHLVKTRTKDCGVERHHRVGSWVTFLSGCTFWHSWVYSKTVSCTAYFEIPCYVKQKFLFHRHLPHSLSHYQHPAPEWYIHYNEPTLIHHYHP